MIFFNHFNKVYLYWAFLFEINLFFYIFLLYVKELFDESQTSQRSGASDEIVGTELLSMSDEQRNSLPTDEVKSTGTSVVGHFGPNEDKVSSGSRCSVEGDPGAGLDVQTNVLSSVLQLLQSQQVSAFAV